MSILVHQKFPANKKDLIQCAQDRKADIDVIECIKKLPDEVYLEISSLISCIQEKKLSSTLLP